MSSPGVSSPLRIAVLSDIHGNIRALEDVSIELRRLAPDLVLNLGDHLSGPLQAADTADFLLAMNWTHIRGNHDRQLLETAPTQMGESDKAALAQLKPRHIAWLESLPALLRLDAGILLCHGTPASDLEYLNETVSPSHVGLRNIDEIAASLADQDDSVILCGHSHQPRLICLPGSKLVLNPGSVGLPAYSDTRPYPHYMETGSPHARFAVLERRANGWSAAFHAIEYNWHAAAIEAKQAFRTDWAYSLDTGYALRT